MTKNAIDTFINIENAAHEGAFGANPRATPTDAQTKAGNYKLGRATIYGLPVAIEQPRHSYRTGQDPGGKRWENKMAAHYGYFSGTKGADGDGVDCFIGFYPQSEQVYIINQYVNGKFDEHKVCLCFPDEETAKRAYLDSYDKGWNGLHSIITASITQFKWWLKNGNMNNQIALNHLPYEGLETMKQRVAWDNTANPIGTALHNVLYEIRRADGGENLIFDSVCMADILDDADEVMALDAMVTPYVKLERKMQVLKSVMERHSDAIKVEAVQISDPFKQSGVAQVAVIFELSDGQTVSIFFHNPDVDPKKIQQSDELISWKWLLNKKDITIVVAPEKGEDLNIKAVAERIMKLADKNSAAFIRANSKRAEKMQAIEGLKTEIVSLEQELKDAQHELEVAKVEVEDKAAKGGIELMRQDVLAFFPELEGPSGKPNGFGISKITLMPGNKIVIESNTKKVLVAETVAKSTETGITYMDIIDQFNKGNIKSVPAEVMTDPIAKYEAFKQATLQALIDKFGWTNQSKTNGPLFYITKRIGGGHTGGMINPEGIREVIAGFEENGMVATHGDTVVARSWFDVSKTPEANADELDRVVNSIDPNYVAPETKEIGSEDGLIDRAATEGYAKAKELGAMPKYVPDWINEIDNGDQALIDAYMLGAKRWIQEQSAGQGNDLFNKVSAAIANVKTIVTDVSPVKESFNSNWLLMNAPRPLVGTKTFENGDFLHGRFYAELDPKDEFFSQNLETNLKLDAYVVLVLNKDTIDNMVLATIPEKFMDAYNRLSDEKKADYLRSNRTNKLSGKTFSEIMALWRGDKTNKPIPQLPQGEAANTPDLTEDESFDREDILAVNESAFAKFQEQHKFQTAGDVAEGLEYDPDRTDLIYLEETAFLVEQEVNAYGGTVLFGNFDTTAYNQSVFDSAITPGSINGEIADKTGAVVARIRIEENGMLTVYSGASGVERVAEPTMAVSRINSTIAAVFGGEKNKVNAVETNNRPGPGQGEVDPELIKDVRINNYDAAYRSAARKILSAIAEINWNAIVDNDTANAAATELGVKARDIPEIIEATNTLEGYGINPADLSSDRVPGWEILREAQMAANEAQDKIFATGKKRLKASGVDKLAKLPTDASLEEKAAAVFEANGIQSNGDFIVDAIKNKDIEKLRSLLSNLDNKSSRTVFELATGIKLAKTVKGTMPQIDEWAGITPEQRAAIESEKQAARNADNLLSDLKYAWNPLEYVNVGDGGSSQTMQAWLIGAYGDGYSHIETRKKGAATTYWLVNKEHKAQGFLKSKVFNAFLKAALAFGEGDNLLAMKKALKALGVDVAEQELTPVERVNEAYSFNADDDFKEWLAESIDKAEQSPFLTAKAMDEAAKRNSADVEWGFFGGMSKEDEAHLFGKTLDSVAGDNEADIAFVDEDELGATFTPDSGDDAVFDSAVMDIPCSWFGFKLANESKVKQQASEVLPSNEQISGDVYMAIANGEEGDEMLVAGTIVGVKFTAMKVFYTVAVIVSPQPKNGVNIYAIIPDVDSIAIRPINYLELEPNALDSVSSKSLFKIKNSAIFDSAALDGVEQDGYVGKITKGGAVVGRIDIDGDGKALVFVGDKGDTRVRYKSQVDGELRDYMYSDDDAAEMVDSLFNVAQAEPINDMEKFIKIAADSIETLRKPDVFRVLDTYSYNEKLAEYIATKRPDLAQEVEELMAEAKSYANNDDKSNEQKSDNRFYPDDIVYMQDITDENKRIPVNFRGYVDDKMSMVVWNGSQMQVETSRLFKEDIQGTGAVTPTPTPEPTPVPVATSNPELDKQRAKLKSLTDLQERMKSANKVVNNKKLSDDQKVEQLMAQGHSEASAREILKPDYAGRTGFASYQLTNNNAVIKSTQKRIEQLEAKELAESLAASGERETSYDFDGGTIDLDYGDDRLRVNFDSKPAADMISKLKQNGFKWSYTNTAWQRQLTDNAISTANYLFGTQIKTAASAMKEEVNKPRGDVIVPATETQPQGNPMTQAFIAELDALKAETNIEAFDRRLDEIAGRIEGGGLMEELDAELNAAADVLTALLAEAEKAA